MLSSEWIIYVGWFITALSLAGTVMNVRKSVWCFYIWTFGNAAWLLIDLKTGFYSRAVLDAVHLALAVWGIFAWRRVRTEGGGHGREK